MQAITYKRYGSSDVLQLKNIEKPTPKEGELLIKIHSAATNPLDWHSMRGEPIFMRLSSGLRQPKNPLLGADFAGEVVGLGEHVASFSLGDHVFGSSFPGAFAEYICVSETEVALKPKNIGFNEAASLPVVTFTALQALRDKGNIQSGEHVLINGASGGVGTLAVQLAKYFGAEVTAVCSHRNIDLVRSIGADHVVDYTKENFTQNGREYDLIIDNVGSQPIPAVARSLTPTGRYVNIGFINFSYIFQVLIRGGIITKTTDKTITLLGMAQIVQADLLFIKERIELGDVVPVIDRTYPLGQTAEAVRYLETGRAKGKVMIEVTS